MKQFLASIALVLLPISVEAATIRYDIGGTCVEGAGAEGSCGLLGMTVGQRYSAFIDIDVTPNAARPFSPFGNFSIGDAVSDWRVDFGNFAFNPGNTKVSGVLGNDSGGMWFDRSDQFLADIDFNSPDLGTYLFVTNLDAKTGQFGSRLFGGMELTNRTTGATSTLQIAPVPLPAAGGLLVVGVGLLGWLARRRRTA